MSSKINNSCYRCRGVKFESSYLMCHFCALIALVRSFFFFAIWLVCCF